MAVSDAGSGRAQRRPPFVEQPAFNRAFNAALFTAIYAGFSDRHRYWETMLAALAGLVTSYALEAIIDRLRPRRRR